MAFFEILLDFGENKCYTKMLQKNSWTGFVVKWNAERREWIQVDIVGGQMRNAQKDKADSEVKCRERARKGAW